MHPAQAAKKKRARHRKDAWYVRRGVNAYITKLIAHGEITGELPALREKP